MTYEYEELGNGVSVPCVHTDLTGSKAPGAARELKDRIFEIVDREGALLFRDAGIDGPVRYAEFLSAIDFRHHSYVGGTAPRTDLGRGVYTATDLPPDTTVMIHQEMAYLDDVPDYISFYCHEPPDNGQKNALDRRHAPGVRGVAGRTWNAKYRGERARLRRTLRPEGSEPVVSRREKSWQEVLGTGDRREAAEIAERKGWELNWTADGSLIFLQEPARFFRPHPVHGEMWCSQGLHYQPMGRRLVAERDSRMGDALRIATAMKEAPGQHRRHAHGGRQPGAAGGLRGLVRTLYGGGDVIRDGPGRDDHPGQHAHGARPIDVHRHANHVRCPRRSRGLTRSYRHDPALTCSTRTSSSSTPHVLP